MAQVKIKGVIYFKVKDNHPDLQCIPEDERDKTHEFCDIYNIDTDCFYGRDDIEHYIEHDLALVAGGGYETDTIKDTKIVLTWGVA